MADVARLLKKVSSMTLLLVSAQVWAAAPQVSTTPATWLARLTGNLSCQEQTAKGSNLGKAVTGLEQDNILVSEAKVARLEGRMFCMSCNCPDGTFDIVKVKSSPEVERLVKSGVWEVIKPTEILENNELSDNNQNTMPVFPEQ